MHERYAAPQAEWVFGDQARFHRWWSWSVSYAEQSMKYDGDHRLIDELTQLPVPTPEAVKTREATTGHDVVAFLSLMTQDAPDAVKRHIHNGLTSSDIVDNAHFEALATHAGAMVAYVDHLGVKMAKWEMSDTRRVGRTHGQIAAPTSWNHQIRVNWEILLQLQNEFAALAKVAPVKSPGPTGRSLDLYDRAAKVAKARMGRVVPSTQIIPRDYQLRWAAVYLRLACLLENLALLVRLGSRAEIAEVQEGAAVDRVGSSAMPHKRNPIDSEKVCGLARVARGYFATIAENTAFWEDRDLTNSSVERIAVPDLAAVVEHMTFTMTKVMGGLQLDHQAMTRDLILAGPWTATAQTLLQKHAMISSTEAGDAIRELDIPPQYTRSFLREVVFSWLVKHRNLEVAEAWMADFRKATQT